MSFARSKSGCVTCKIRKVKCDETRPVCQRCSQSRRQCGGYAVSRALIFDPEVSRQERRSFQFIRERIYDILEVQHDDDFVLWNQLILQTSHRNAAIRHGVLFLSSYYDSLNTPSDARQHLIQADQHYHGALLAASGPLALQQAPSAEEILVLCLLFHCIEIFRQQYGNAFIHLQAALKIVGESTASGSSRSLTTSIVDRLKKWPNRDVNAISIAADACTPLTTFASARQRLSHIHSWICRQLYMSRAGYENIGDLCRRFQLQLLDWKGDFEKLYSRADLTADNETRSAIYIRISYGLVALAVSMVLAEQSDHHSLQPSSEDQRIKELLRDCQAFARSGKSETESDSRKESSTTRPVHFGFDTELILIIVFLASMTTQYTLRQYAIALLRSAHRQEGSWDSLHAAHIIECLERGSPLQDSVIISTVAYFNDRSYSSLSQENLKYSRPSIVRVDKDSRDLTNPSTVWFKCTCDCQALCAGMNLSDDDIQLKYRNQYSTGDMIPVYEQTEFTPSMVTQILTASRYRLGNMPTHMGSSVLAVRQQQPAPTGGQGTK